MARRPVTALGAFERVTYETARAVYQLAHEMPCSHCKAKPKNWCVGPMSGDLVFHAVRVRSAASAAVTMAAEAIVGEEEE